MDEERASLRTGELAKRFMACDAQSIEEWDKEFADMALRVIRSGPSEDPSIRLRLILDARDTMRTYCNALIQGEQQGDYSESSKIWDGIKYWMTDKLRTEYIQVQYEGLPWIVPWYPEKYVDLPLAAQGDFFDYFTQQRNALKAAKWLLGLEETEEDKMLDINEAAKVVGITPNALRKRAQRGTVPHETIGSGKIRKVYAFREQELKQWMKTDMRVYERLS